MDHNVALRTLHSRTSLIQSITSFLDTVLLGYYDSFWEIKGVTISCCPYATQVYTTVSHVEMNN